MYQEVLTLLELQKKKEQSRYGSYSITGVGGYFFKYILSLPTIKEKIQETKIRKLMAKKELQLEENENLEKLESGAIFGNFYAISAKKYRPMYVIAMSEDTRIIEIDSEQITLILEKLSNCQMFQQNLKLITKTINVLGKSSTVSKNRIARCFKERVFLPQQVIIKENEISTSAYIIKEGECIVVSFKNPLDYQLSGEQEIQENQNKCLLSADKGYISTSLKHFKLGLLNKGEWVGDEIILFKDEPMPFTVIAQTKTSVLEISIEDFFQKLPLQYQNQLKQTCVKRLKWFTKRMIDITGTTQKVQNMDKQSCNYSSTQNSVILSLPKAGPQVIKNLGNKQLLKGTRLFRRERKSVDYIDEQRIQQIDEERDYSFSNENVKPLEQSQFNQSSYQQNKLNKLTIIRKLSGDQSSFGTKLAETQFQSNQFNNENQSKCSKINTFMEQRKGNVRVTYINSKQIEQPNLDYEFSEIPRTAMASQNQTIHFNTPIQNKIQDSKCRWGIRSVRKSLNFQDQELPSFRSSLSPEATTNCETQRLMNFMESQQSSRPKQIKKATYNLTPYVKSFRQQMLSRRSSMNDEQYQGINEKRNLAPNINNIFLKSKESSYVLRCKAQISNRRLLDNIKQEANTKNNKIEIGQRIFKVLEKFKADKSLSSIGAYCKKLDKFDHQF